MTARGQGRGTTAELRAEGLVEDGAQAVPARVPDPDPFGGADAEEELERGERHAEGAVRGPLPVDDAGDAAARRKLIHVYVHLHEVRVVQHLREGAPEEDGEPGPRLGELWVEPRGEGGLPRG